MTIGTAWSDLRLNFHTYCDSLKIWHKATKFRDSKLFWTIFSINSLYVSVWWSKLHLWDFLHQANPEFPLPLFSLFCDAVGGQRANMAFLSRCKMAVSTFSNIPGDHRMTRKINSRWQWIDWACFDGQSDTWSIACLSSLHIDLTGYSQSFLFCLHKAL